MCPPGKLRLALSFKLTRKLCRFFIVEAASLGELFYKKVREKMQVLSEISVAVFQGRLVFILYRIKTKKHFIFYLFYSNI